jgi:hypothetical protein
LPDDITIAYWTPAVTGTEGASATERNPGGFEIGIDVLGRFAVARIVALGTPPDVVRIWIVSGRVTIAAGRDTARSSWSRRPVRPFVNVCAVETLLETKAEPFPITGWDWSSVPAAAGTATTSADVSTATTNAHRPGCGLAPRRRSIGRAICFLL